MSNKKYFLVLIFGVILGLISHAQRLPEGFVYLTNVIPSIELELRYFGHHNFIGIPIDGYNQEKGIITEKTAKSLKRIQHKLNKRQLGLKIYDAYRPQKAVNHFARWAKNLNDTLKKNEYYPNVKKENLFKEEYIAYRSGHSRGSTVDITIIDLSTPEKKELDMGSSYDFFGHESWVSYTNLSKEQLGNRLFIQEIMKKNNFKNYTQEWWHFTLKNEPFPNTYFDFSIE